MCGDTVGLDEIRERIAVPLAAPSRDTEQRFGVLGTIGGLLKFVRNGSRSPWRQMPASPQAEGEVEAAAGPLRAAAAYRPTYPHLAGGQGWGRESCCVWARCRTRVARGWIAWVL